MTLAERLAAELRDLGGEGKEPFLLCAGNTAFSELKAERGPLQLKQRTRSGFSMVYVFQGFDLVVAPGADLDKISIEDIDGRVIGVLNYWGQQ